MHVAQDLGAHGAHGVTRRGTGTPGSAAHTMARGAATRTAALISGHDMAMRPPLKPDFVIMPGAPNGAIIGSAKSVRMIRLLCADTDS